MNASPPTLRPEIAALLPRLRRFARAIDGATADADALVHGAIERTLASVAPSPDGLRLDHRLLRCMADAHRDAARAQRVDDDRTADTDTDTYTDTDADADAEPDVDARAHAAAAVGTPGVGIVDPLSRHPVGSAMARLPVDQRIAIALVLVDGLSWRAAAELLEIRVGVLTTRLLHGRDTLLLALDADGTPPPEAAQARR